MKARTITKEFLRLEFDGKSRDFNKTPLNQESVYEPDWNKLVNVLKVALKERMEACRENVMTNSSKVIYCTDNEVWFQDHSLFALMKPWKTPIIAYAIITPSHKSELA